MAVTGPLATWMKAALPAAQAQGVPISYLQTLAQRESGGQNIPQGVNSTGTAFGPFQFQKGTWEDLAQRHPELGLTAQDRFNPTKQAVAAVSFTADNAKQLQGALNRPATPAELSLAHQFGAAGAAKILTAPPGTSVAAILPDAVAANPQWAKITTGDIVSQANNAYNSDGGGDGASTMAGSPASTGPAAANPPPTGIGLFGDRPGPAPQNDPFGGMSPQLRQIYAVALQDPTLGPQVLPSLLKAMGEGEQQQALLNAKAASQNPLTGMTDLVKNGLAMGLQPGTPEFQQWIQQGTMKPLAAVNVTTGAPVVNTGGPVPVNKAVETRFEQALAGGDAARNSINRIDQLQEALKGFPSGKGAETLAQVGSYLKTVGIDPKSLNLPDTAGQAQVIKTLINPMVLELRNPSGGAGMPGAMSEGDRKFLQESAASIENRPNANAGILMMARQIQQRNLDIENLAIKHLEEHGGNVAPSFLREVRDYGDAHPLFTKDFQKQYEATMNRPEPNVLGQMPDQPPAMPTAADLSGMSREQIYGLLQGPLGGAIIADPKLRSVLDAKRKAP